MSSSTGASSSDWTLITVTYNSSRQLEECWSDRRWGDARWIVVDNASSDDSVSLARALGAEVIPLPTNVGFGAANNVALQHVISEWVAFVNPDVRIADATDLSRLARVARANCSFVAPQLLNVDGTRQQNARGIPYFLDKLAHRSLKLPTSRVEEYVRIQFDAPTFVSWVMGAAVAGRGDDFRRIGAWDERYFVYYEDHDIGLTAWRQGIPIVVDPHVMWMHVWQRETTSRRIQPWRREIASGLRFYSKYPWLLPGMPKKRGLSRHGEMASRLWTEARDG